MSVVRTERQDNPFILGILHALSDPLSKVLSQASFEVLHLPCHSKRHEVGCLLPCTLHAPPALTSQDKRGLYIVCPWHCQCGWQGSYRTCWVSRTPFSGAICALTAATPLAVRFSLWLTLSCSEQLALHLVRDCCPPVGATLLPYTLPQILVSCPIF